MLSKKKVIASCQGRANTKVCTHAFLHSKNKSLVLFHLGLFHLGSAHIKKIWTKCVENYLFQVHGHEEQSCFSLSFQRKPSNKAPHAVTHLTHSHTHGTLTGTGLVSVLLKGQETVSNHFWAYMSPLLPLWPCQSCQGDTDRPLFKMHQSPPLQWLNEKATIISGWSKSNSAAFGHVENVKVVRMKTPSPVD